MDAIWNYLAQIFADPEIIDLVSILVAGVLTAFVKQLVGAYVGSKHMDAFQSAIKSAVEATLRDNPEAGLDVLRREAVRHLRGSVPKAFRNLMPKLEARTKEGQEANPDSDPVLERLVKRYAAEAKSLFK